MTMATIKSNIKFWAVDNILVMADTKENAISAWRWAMRVNQFNNWLLKITKL